MSLNDLLASRRTGTGCYISIPVRGAPECLTFADLYRRAAYAAEGLRQIEVGQHAASEGPVTAVLAVRDPLSFVTAFFASAWAGWIPVPAPGRIREFPHHRRRLRQIIGASQADHVITDSRQRRDLAAGTGGLDVGQVILDDILGPVGAICDPPATARDNPVAYVQYTSGSISRPKPVSIGQRQVISHLRQAALAYGETRASVSVNWVPLYHDMGLVTSVLRPLWSDCTSVIIDPFDFVREPECWLSALSEWRATHTSAPDFGYSLCASKVADASRFDLCNLEVARSAGEMVRRETLRQFSAAFRPAGFDYAAFAPSFGLAEATLTVTSCRPDQTPRIIDVSRAKLREDRVSQPDGESDNHALVSAGPPLDDTTVLILDPQGRPFRAQRQIGEIWIAGPQVVVDDFSNEIDGCVGRRTGDIGFLDDGELVPLGRSRERFQIRGENYYSGDLEALVVATDNRLRPGRAAAFLSGVPEGTADPSVVVLAELRANGEPLRPADLAAIERKIRLAARQVLGLSLGPVALLPAGSLPRTTSGKLRREECRALVESGRDDWCAAR
jgi:acyl-CoA synthetase (AMP-forming)/AMP-acid ligase II